MDRERLDEWCELTIVGLVLAILVLGPLTAGLGLTSEFEVVRDRPFLLLLGLTIPTILAWALRLWIGTKERLLWPPICWTVVAFTVYAIARYRTADLEYVARSELLRVLVYAFLFLIILDTFHRQEFTTVAAVVLVSLAMLISAYAAYQFFTASPYVWNLRKPIEYVGRGSGTFIYPNNYAAFIGMILPLGLAFALSSRLSHGAKVVLAYASILMIAGLALSLSRGGWIASGIALALFFAVLVRYRETRLPAILFFVAVLGGGLYLARDAPKLKNRWDQMLSGRNAISEPRFYLWQSAIRVWQDNVWWGSGPGHFDYRFPAHRPEIIQARPRRAHNDYLNALADWGIAGGALVLSAFAALCVGIAWTWKHVRRTSDLSAKPSNRSAFVLGASTGLVAIAIHSFFDFNMHLPANAILAVSLMAMTSGFLRFASDRFWVRIALGRRIAFTVICVTGASYLSVQFIRRLQEYRLLRMADFGQTAISASFQAREEMLRSGQENGALDLPELDKLSRSISEGYLTRMDLLRRASEVEPMNAETPQQLGQSNRLISWAGGDDSHDRAQEAIRWFQASAKLNPYDPYNPVWKGLCLDWLGNHEESEMDIQRALSLDPKNYFLLTLVGYHYFIVGNYPESKRWLLEAQRLADWRWNTNELAKIYLEKIKQIEALELQARGQR